MLEFYFNRVNQLADHLTLCGSKSKLFLKLLRERRRRFGAAELWWFPRSETRGGDGQAVPCGSPGLGCRSPSEEMGLLW